MTISVKVLFFEISAKMKSICANSSQTGFVLIDHYSSKSGEWRHVQFDTTQYQEAFAEVQKIEKAMSFITAEVKKKSYDELSHLRLVAKPCPEGNQNNALFYEVWNEIKSLQIEIVESEALQMSEKTKGLKDLLTQLQNLTTKDCSWQDLEKIQRNITTFLRIKNCP